MGLAAQVLGAQALGDQGLRRPKLIFLELHSYNFHLWAFFLTFNIALFQKLLLVPG